MKPYRADAGPRQQAGRNLDSAGEARFRRREAAKAADRQAPAEREPLAGSPRPALSRRQGRDAAPQRTRIPAASSQCSGFSELRQRRVRGRDRDPVRPVRRADRDIAREPPEPAGDLGVADRHQAAGLRHLVEVRHPLGLGVAVVQQPVLPLQRRRRVGVERLVAVEEDVPLLVQELQRVEADAGEGEAGRERRVRPVLRPARAHEDDRAFRDRPVRLLPGLDVGDLQRVARVLRHLLLDRDHHQRPDGVGRRQLVDRRILRRPVRRRVELGAELVGGEAEGRRLEPALLEGEDVALGGEPLHVVARLGRRELLRPEPRPHRHLRRDRVREVDVLRPLQRRVVDAPEPRLVRQRRQPRSASARGPRMQPFRMSVPPLRP